MIRTADMPPPVAPRGRNGHAVGRRAGAPSAPSPNPAPGDRPPPDVAAGPGPTGPPHRYRVTAVHDSIDFARALVQDGGSNTAGLTMLRGEIAAIGREVRAMRTELAATRADCERVRMDMVALATFTRGVLLDRLAVRFAAIDSTLRRLDGGAVAAVAPDYDGER